MGHNPTVAMSFVLIFGAYVSLVAGAQTSVPVIPECEDFLDVLTGCASTVSTFVSIGILGTIPGAPDVVNVFFAILGLIARANIVWAVLQLLRGS